jgi:hypothetical protein
MRFIQQCYFLLLGLLLLCGQVAWAEPVKPQTEGFYTIYLTYNRACKQCQLTDLQDGTVYLVNSQGVGATYPATDILGVDYHPIQRRFQTHLANTLNPHAARTLLPNSVEHREYQDWYNPNPELYKPQPNWWRHP